MTFSITDRSSPTNFSLGWWEKLTTWSRETSVSCSKLMPLSGLGPETWFLNDRWLFSMQSWAAIARKSRFRTTYSCPWGVPPRAVKQGEKYWREERCFEVIPMIDMKVKGCANRLSGIIDKNPRKESRIAAKWPSSASTDSNVEKICIAPTSAPALAVLILGQGSLASPAVLTAGWR